MSIVIVGGHERMVGKYKTICRTYHHKVKVFTQMTADLNKQMGRPDMFIVFTNTVSHKMVKCALDEAKRSKAQIIRCHTSSSTALTDILENVG